MARTVEYRCDICHKPTEAIVAKLHFIPRMPGASRSIHSNYTHHADVGLCCKERLLRGFNFRERITAEEYHERRKNGVNA